MKIEIDKPKKIPFKKVGHGDLFTIDKDELYLKSEDIVISKYDGLVRGTINAISIRTGEGVFVVPDKYVTPVKSITVEI